MNRATGIAAVIVLLVLVAPGGAAVAPRSVGFPVAGNGSLLLHRNTGQLYVLGPRDVRPRAIPDVTVGGDGAGGAAWSPDGSQLAVGAGDAGLVVYDLHTRRTTVAAIRGKDPSWSPDGSRLAFTGRNDQIYIKALGHRGRPRHFTSGTEPTWSPDGSRIAYNMSGGIAVRSLAGGTRVLFRDYSDDSCSVGYSSPDWSPVFADEIAYGVSSACSSAGVANWGEVGVTGSRCCTVAGPWQDGPSGPVLSPDGRRLAFADSAADGRLAIFTWPKRMTTRTKGAWYPLDWQSICTLRGTPHSETIAGRSRPDLICGLGGADSITGGAGGDRVFGGNGRDRVDVWDSAFDVVGCGPGRDSVLADRRDLVGFDCERVARR